ncbi:jerky protein homolog-like [Neodiprion fabricii]|uniref:jerky protein homolog-like n=1 Tax=Neodiprion fabricii TaxID=2872261 RepID=UPI001ED8F35B|nr:jerky protein homolog-like [Neodiprion fabricii]
MTKIRKVLWKSKKKGQGWKNFAAYQRERLRYNESYIPSVKEKQENSDQRGKVLLLLDNAPSHPAADELNAVDKDFAIMYFPPNVTSIIQPMDQDVIETAKRIYKPSLVRRHLLSDNIPMVQLIKQLSLKDCCEMVAAAWEEVTSSSLQKAWNNLICLITPMGQDIVDVTNEYLQGTVNLIPDVNVSNLDIAEWLREDDDNETSEVLNDDQIVAFVTSRNDEDSRHDKNLDENENWDENENLVENEHSDEKENWDENENCYSDQYFKGAKILGGMQFEQEFLPDTAQGALTGIIAASHGSRHNLSVRRAI